MNNRKIIRIILAGLLFAIYYQVDYKRHFLFNKDKTEFFTVWQRLGNNCYLIPGKYYGIIPPEKNYIKTANYKNYIGIIWETNDEYSSKVSIYNDFNEEQLDPTIKTYMSNDSLLLEYGILVCLDFLKGKRVKNINSDSLMRLYDYNYVDLNRMYGIKVARSNKR